MEELDYTGWIGITFDEDDGRCIAGEPRCNKPVVEANWWRASLCAGHMTEWLTAIKQNPSTQEKSQETVQ